MVPAAATAAAVVAVFLPYLPAGPDLYVHLLWCWEVMRCLAVGALPVWLPDLNAGFGSPGIRFYSPLAPLVQGAAGLALGGAWAALRAVPVIVFGAFLMVVRRRRTSGGGAEWGIVVASPIVAYSLLGRGAWSEFLAVPLLWWLLDVAVDGDLSPRRDGVVLALLWLLHAPTTLMALVLMGLAALGAGARHSLTRLAVAAAVAGGLTAWHWLPLSGESRLMERAALTGGSFTAARNVLGSASAHALGETVWLGWCAVALLAAAALGRWWRHDRRRVPVLVAAVGLASPLALPLYASASPLALLQFPWRWLLPATVLAARPAYRALRTRRGYLAFALLLTPLVVLPTHAFVRDPGLAADTTWQAAGARVFASMGGNPAVVDAAQNRPPSWQWLAANLALFGSRLAILEPPGGGKVEVRRWEPLRRDLEVDVARGGEVALRLLAFPFWRATVDGIPVAVLDRRGVVAVAVPHGRHLVRVRWGGDPLARIGIAAAAVTVLALVWECLRAARLRRGVRGV